MTSSVSGLEEHLKSDSPHVENVERDSRRSDEEPEVEPCLASRA